MMLLRLFAAAALLVSSGAAQARNIVLSNDDGLTSNVHALYHALKEQGHDVIVSVPCHNQSGMGAAVKFLRPIGPLKENCLHDAAKAGDPGAGPMTRDGFETDFYYVEGTPVMAMLYGVDVVASQRWGKAPDMVISGINEGRNAGPIVLASGTVSNAQIALARGIPAIAISAGLPTRGDATLEGAPSTAVAKLASELIALLDKRGGKDGSILPKGVGLNVNFPDDLTRAQWVPTRIGTFAEISPRFTTDIAAALAAEPRVQGIIGEASFPALPGVMIELPSAGPTSEQMGDEAVVSQRHITVSPMQMGYSNGDGDLQSWIAALFVKSGDDQ